MTEEELKTVEDFAELHFSIEQIAIFLGKEVSELKLLFRKKGNNFYNSVMRGRLKSEFALRKTVLQDAKNGSSPAQAQFLSIIKNTRLEDLK
ncbi:hypothetical protein V9L05_15250 [Bernardetia sp. Wsw4-3y2]|uniref:hypothetical protein n=1 Tax=Bernardetia sp. Wsw4-3y2 TaxID=3127471 RepID=UPI0030D37CA4